MKREIAKAIIMYVCLVAAGMLLGLAIREHQFYGYCNAENKKHIVLFGKGFYCSERYGENIK